MNFNKKGFTLIELLIVIGIIAILAAGVIVAINPGRQFAQARDATRRSHINTLNKALLSYQVSNQGNLSGLSLPTEPTEICNTNLTSPTCTDLVDLSDLVAEGHLNQLPVDPQGGVSETSDGTGYEVAEGSIILVAPLAETRFIGIGIAEGEYGGDGESCSGFTYSPTGSWGAKIDTTVRDYYTVDDSTATVEKDIYCDDENCIFLTDAATTPSGDVCVAENAGVYMGVLWDKTNADSRYSYGEFDSTLSSLGVVGGTHNANLEVGIFNLTEAAGKDWLDEGYDSNTYTFPAMDACIAKGEGWRLPNIRELDSIRDELNFSDPNTGLPNMLSDNYLSSSEADSGAPYGLAFNNSRLVSAVPKFDSYEVRCVRGQ